VREGALSFLLDLIEVQKVTDPNHPEHGKFGVFAKVALDKNKVLGEYTGAIQLTDTKKTSGFASILFDNYVHSVDVDAEKIGNEFRFLNDYRGTSISRPNVTLSATVFNGEWHIAVLTTRIIPRGTELVVDYGPTYWDNQS